MGCGVDNKQFVKVKEMIIFYYYLVEMSVLKDYIF